MSSRRVRANPGEGGRLRDEILLVAERMLVESGTEDVLTLRAVAERAGVTTPSVYRHFASKDQLVEAVCLRAWDGLGSRIREACARLTDPFIALGQCGRAYIRFALDHPVQYRVLMMRRAAGPEVSPASEACFGYMVDAVAACVDNGVLRGEPRTLALSLWSAMHGCASLLIAQPSLPWPEDLDEFVNDMVRMAGFGAAVSTRLPRTAVPRSADVAAGADTMVDRMRGSVWVEVLLGGLRW
ncbi:TetR/AcrR family transcriptional regulator [Saccharopolyspora sp. K220]|uniref:TetR/AcrR family transcriptional regulator n=1 Tax=Saccharopolyspora soli TaxID=2926618 RepID=UPI001F5777D6|nr:TetR/AcrR family transcriptional regulator [Saccharopolyspora soli]MCI2419101.1 TetR/AcrR family transcriptional regulator [Saccharopolyspora soli]